jgi:hypothetical protein
VAPIEGAEAGIETIEDAVTSINEQVGDDIRAIAEVRRHSQIGYFNCSLDTTLLIHQTDVYNAF